MKAKALILSFLLFQSLGFFGQEAQEFEYLVVDFGYLYGVMRLKTAGYRLMNDDIVEDLIAEKDLDYLGSLGWSLVAITGNQSNNILVFKRTKDEKWNQIEEKLKADEALIKPKIIDTPIPEATPTRNWYSFSKKDPLTDTAYFVFSTEAKSGKNSAGSSLFLNIRIYDTGSSDFFINCNEYLGSEAKVAWRVDKDDAVFEEWQLSTDSEAAFYQGDQRALFKRLSEANEFVFKITPYNESPIIAIFDVIGFKEFLAENPEVIQILEKPAPPSER